MGSLPTKAGRYNPKSFSDLELDYNYRRKRSYKNSVLQGTSTSLALHRSLYCDSFSGRVLDNFHRRKASGELLPYTRYTMLKHDVSNSGANPLFFSVLGTTTGNVWEFYYDWLDGSPLPVQDGVTFSIAKLTDADRVLAEVGADPYTEVQQAAARMYSRGWDGLTFLAELHKVVSMFRNSIPKVIDLILEYVKYRRNFRAAARTAKTLSQWLEGRYGWRVLIYDIIDMNELIRSVGEDQLSRVKDRAGSNFTHLDSSTFIGSDTNITRHYVDVTEYSVSLRGSIIADFMPSKISLNPIVTVWELVPFSFVIDWFFSVGKALQALSFLALNNQYTACASYYIQANRQVSFSHLTFTDPYSTLTGHNFDTCNVSESWEIKDRRPVVVPYLPRIAINLDAFKVLDLVALLGQAVLQLSRR